MRSIIFILICCAAKVPDVQSQSNIDLDLIIGKKDSLLFQVGFNQCNLTPFHDLLDDQFEFYHDQSGSTRSKVKFIEQIEQGLCKLDYQATREIIAGSIEVFPLKSSGVLYGAVQQGKHRFYAKYGNKEPEITSEARFTHLWLVDQGKWTLKRVLSFDHHAPD